MRLQEYQNAVQALPHGKRLPNAVYVYRGDGVPLDGELNAVVDRLVEVHGVGPGSRQMIRFSLGTENSDTAAEVKAALHAMGRAVTMLRG
jgi:hypothetical protein